MSNWVMVTKEEGEFLAHSSGPWKKHKYVSKDGKHYIYARVSGKGIKKALMSSYDKDNDGSRKAPADHKARLGHSRVSTIKGHKFASDPGVSAGEAAKVARQIKENHPHKITDNPRQSYSKGIHKVSTINKKGGASEYIGNKTRPEIKGVAYRGNAASTSEHMYKGNKGKSRIRSRSKKR